MSLDLIFSNDFEAGPSSFPVDWTPLQAGAWSVSGGKLISDSTVGSDFAERKLPLHFANLGTGLHQRYVVRQVIADGSNGYHLRGVAARLQAPVQAIGVGNSFYALAVRINPALVGDPNKLEIQAYAHTPANNFINIGSSFASGDYGSSTAVDCIFEVSGANPTTIKVEVRDATTQALILSFTGTDSTPALQQPGLFALSGWNWGDLGMGPTPREAVSIWGEPRKKPRKPDLYRTTSGFGWSTDGDRFQVERNGAVIAEVEGKAFATSAPGTYRVRAVRDLPVIGGFVVDGDSIASGFGPGVTVPFPTALSGLNGWGHSNLGVAGVTLAEMVSTYESRGVGALFHAQTKNTLLLHGGVNDILFNGATTLASLQADTLAYAAKAHASGFRLYVLTALSSATITTAQNNLRLAFNTWLRNFWTTFAEGLIDVASIPELSGTPVPGSTYWADGDHPTNAGHALIAQLAQTQLRAPTFSIASYVLALGAGSFASAGQPVGLARILQLPVWARTVEAGAWPVALRVARRLPLDVRAVQAQLQDVAASRARRFAIDARAVALAGSEIRLERKLILPIDAASFIMPGYPVELARSRAIQIEAAGISLEGQAVELARVRTFPIDAGAVSAAGQGVALGASRILQLEAGAVAAGGQPVGLLRGRRLVLGARAVALARQPAGLIAARILGAGAGAVALEGNNLALSAARSLRLEAGALDLGGQTADLIVARALGLGVGAVAADLLPVDLTPDFLAPVSFLRLGALDVSATVSADVRAARLLPIAGRAVAAAGGALGLFRGRRLGMDPRAVTAAALPLILTRSRRLDLDPLAVALGEAQAGLVASRLLSAAAGAVVLSGGDLSWLRGERFSIEVGEISAAWGEVAMRRSRAIALEVAALDLAGQLELRRACRLVIGAGAVQLIGLPVVIRKTGEVVPMVEIAGAWGYTPTIGGIWRVDA